MRLLSPTAWRRGGGSDWVFASWVASAEYKRGEGVIEFEFSAKLKPHLLGLTKDFTLAEAERLITLRTGYAAKLYMNLKRHSYKNRRIRYRLSTLRMILGVDLVGENPQKRRYKNYNDLKRHVLDDARKEIEDKMPMRFEFTPIKTGRRVTDVEFYVTQGLVPSEQLFLEEGRESPRPLTREIVSAFPPGEFDQKTAERIESNKWSYVEWGSPKMKDREPLELLRAEGLPFEQYVREKMSIGGGKGAGYLVSAIKYNWTTTQQKAAKQKAVAKAKNEKRAAMREGDIQRQRDEEARQNRAIDQQIETLPKEVMARVEEGAQEKMLRLKGRQKYEEFLEKRKHGNASEVDELMMRGFRRSAYEEQAPLKETAESII
ncbi:replication initiation protein [Rhodothermus sp. AH-315-K08]|nr:replication initiation protein [Rhodothermus sp. AH-315-K08]